MKRHPFVIAAAGLLLCLAPALIAHTGMLPGDPGELAKRIPASRVGQPCEVADLAIAILGN